MEQMIWGDTHTECSAAALSLTDAFELSVSGQAVTLPHSVQRVLAFLGLAGRPVSRPKLAGALWQDSREPLGAKSLRTALWRLHRLGGEDLVTTQDDRVALSPDVPVDVAELTRLAQQLIRGPIQDQTLEQIPLLLGQRELLPDWEEAWVVVDRERYRLLRLEALESAAAELLSRHRLADAVVGRGVRS